MGKSDGAKWRRQRNPVGTLHGGQPGSTFKIGDTVYAVAADGSFRKGAVIGA